MPVEIEVNTVPHFKATLQTIAALPNSILCTKRPKFTMLLYYITGMAEQEGHQGHAPVDLKICLFLWAFKKILKIGQKLIDFEKNHNAMWRNNLKWFRIIRNFIVWQYKCDFVWNLSFFHSFTVFAPVVMTYAPVASKTLKLQHA